MMRRPLALGAAAGIAVGAGAYYADEGVRRQLEFWRQVLPIYAHYRYLQYVDLPMRKIESNSDEGAAEYDKLHARYAPVVERATLKLRGFYLKAAQLVSTRDDMVPEEYMRWCKRMQSEVPTPFAPGEGKRIVQAALGGADMFDATFSHWDDTPHGSASIGVVHRARLAGSDREVAVKVQMPGIEAKFRTDLLTIKRFCTIAMPQHLSALQEIENQFRNEFDYELEASHLQQVYTNISQSTWRKRVVVPRPVPELCRKHVLVMDFIPGVKLHEGIREQWRRVAEREGVPFDVYADRQLTAPPRDLATSASRHRLLHVQLLARDAVANIWRIAYNVTLGIALGFKPLVWTEMPINLADTIRLLAEIHAHEIFVDGCFNGDPHPGNILLMPDGRLGLVDYGQVKTISVDSRRQYAKLIVALADRDYEEAIRVASEFGLRTRRMDPDVMWRLLAFHHDRDTADVTMGLNLQLFMEWAEAKDPMVYTPPDLIVPARVSMMMRGLGNVFGVKASVAQLWRPYAVETLRQAP